MNYKIVTATNKDLYDFYKNWSLTFIGVDMEKENIDWLANWLKPYNDGHDIIIYNISGKLMNTHYNLTGDNSYPNDLNIIAIKLSDLTNIEKLALARFEIDGRWFTDIVDNNTRREEETA